MLSLMRLESPSDAPVGETSFHLIGYVRPAVPVLTVAGLSTGCMKPTKS